MRTGGELALKYELRASQSRRATSRQSRFLRFTFGAPKISQSIRQQSSDASLESYFVPFTALDWLETSYQSDLKSQFIRESELNRYEICQKNDLELSRDLLVPRSHELSLSFSQTQSIHHHVISIS
jgi:hypothetical protein